MEFAIQLPQTPGPQRCTVNVNLDSSLPVIKERPTDLDALPFIIILQRKWRATAVSIDFVDFLVAKSFCTVVEEWFACLQKTPEKSFNPVLMRNQAVVRDALIQGGRIGMAAFLAAYVWFSSGNSISFNQITLAVAVGLLIWAVFQIVESRIAKTLLRRIVDNVLPAVILLTEADKQTYAATLQRLNSPTRTLAGLAGAILFSVSVNMLASFLFVYLTKK